MNDKKRLKVLDLFAGAGGFGLGFALAGSEVTCSLEMDQWATDTLRANNPDMTVIQDDIRNYQTLSDIRSATPTLPDIIIGGPPCQGFSIAGPAQKDPKDPRNSLFQNFACWVEYLQPQIFVMENVKGILSRRNANRERVIDIIGQTFRHLGYSVEVWQLNAAEYGVPQTRQRVFIVGNRLGMARIEPPPKTHLLSKSNIMTQQLSLFDVKSNPTTLLPVVTLWDAISDLPELEAGQGEEEQAYQTNAKTGYQRGLRQKQPVLYNHVAMRHSKRLVERFKHIGWGESSSDVPKEHMPRTRSGNGKLSKQAYDQNNRRLYPYKPSHTIAASFYANFVHPFQHRNITAREGARIQSFPDWYRFMGKKTIVSHKLLQREGRIKEKHLCQYNQIGNAVPPLLAKAIAERVQEATVLGGKSELNTGQVGNIQAINQNVSQLAESGNAEVAEAIKQMTEAVANLNEEELSSDEKEEILDNLEILSAQASLAPQERLKTGVIKAIWNGLNTSIQSAGGLAAVWATWELVIRSFFGF